MKDFGGRLGAYALEHALLGRLRGMPIAPLVPRLLAPRRFGELRYAYVDGVSGNAAIEAGLAPQVLRAMGAFLRQLHAVDARDLADLLPGDGPGLVHGDFAPYNTVVDGSTGALVGVLDWEEAHRGRPALDLAWCEWQFTTRYPHLRWAIRHLYDAYGDAPPPRERDEALEHRFTELRARAVTQIEAGRTRETPRLHRLRFSTRAEAAAFVAALSRFLSSPAGAEPAASASPTLVWAAHEDGGSQCVYLTDAALRAATRGFGAPPAEAVEFSRVPVACELLYGTGAMPAWGATEADRRLTKR